MFFLLEPHFEVLCCCLHALQKSPSNFIKSQIHLLDCSHPQRFMPPSRRPRWWTPSSWFPLAYKVPTHSVSTHFFHHSLSSHQEFRGRTRAFPSVCCLGLHTSVLSHILGFYSQPGWSQKTQHPAEAQCKTKHKQMTHLHTCVSMKPGLFFPVLWTHPAAQFLQQNCLDK